MQAKLSSTPVEGVRGIDVEPALHMEWAKLGTAGYPLMVIDRATGLTYSIKAVTTDHHDEADGSYTTWLEIEEN